MKHTQEELVELMVSRGLWEYLPPHELYLFRQELLEQIPWRLPTKVEIKVKSSGLILSLISSTVTEVYPPLSRFLLGEGVISLYEALDMYVPADLR